MSPFQKQVLMFKCSKVGHIAKVSKTKDKTVTAVKQVVEDIEKFRVHTTPKANPYSVNWKD